MTDDIYEPPTEAEIEADYEEFKPSLAVSGRASRAVIAAYWRDQPIEVRRFDD